MNVGAFFSALYRLIARQPLPVLAVTAVVVALSFVAMGRVSLENDIGVMLPDGERGYGRDFLWLEKAPLARRVVVDLARESSVYDETLLAAAAAVEEVLVPPLFTGTLKVPEGVASDAGQRWLLAAPPNLFTAAAARRAAAFTDPARRADRFSEIRRRLEGPEGWALEASLRGDPLGLGSTAIEGLRRATVVPEATLVGGRLATPDGRRLLLVADTAVPVTDYDGATRIGAALDGALGRLPAGVTGSWLSGHRYTVANARAIQRDLVVVLTVSAVAVLAIYLLMLRSWYAIAVFLVPLSVVGLAGAGVSLLYAKIFAVTIGFGGVLLGMADEYAMHVYFHLRRGGNRPDAIVGGIARPVLVGGMVTAAAFGVMLFSSLPGQRQLAVFCLLGIGASLAISLVILPHLIPAAKAGTGDAPLSSTVAARRPSRWIVGPWILLLLVSAWYARGLSFDGGLRSMNLVPAELQSSEASLRSSWGGIRDRAVAFVEGKSLGEALDANDRLFTALDGRVGEGGIVSLATLLPGPTAQTANRERWIEFWGKGEGRRIAADLVAEGGALGFSETAFEPFLRRIGERAAPLTMEDLEGAGVAQAFAGMVVADGDSYRVLTLLPDTSAVAALFDSPGGVPAGARLVSQSGFGRMLGKTLAREFLLYLAAASAVIILLTSLMLRRVVPVLLAMVPVVTGLLFMFGVMGAIGIPFNLFNIVATVLIIGLCVDYGIFMVHQTSGEGAQVADRSVLVSGLTTIAGLGSLILAKHPALHSIGLTVVLGFGAAIPAALLVIPALSPRREGEP
jgi:predicted exporter